MGELYGCELYLNKAVYKSTLGKYQKNSESQ